MAEEMEQRRQLDLAIVKALEHWVEIEERNATERQEIHDRLTNIQARLDQVPHELHAKHHQMLDAMLEERAQAAEFWREVRTKLATAGIWSSLVLIFTALWFAFNSYLSAKTGAPPPHPPTLP